MRLRGGESNFDLLFYVGVGLVYVLSAANSQPGIALAFGIGALAPNISDAWKKRDIKDANMSLAGILIAAAWFAVENIQR